MEGIVEAASRTGRTHAGTRSSWPMLIALVLWGAAAAVAFLPFALDTSPWDAVRLQVPGNQGNWWHVLVGAPFFLAFPIIYVRLRVLFTGALATKFERACIRALAGLSIAGTVLVEAPFLLHLAGTSKWQRVVVLSLGLGIIAASGTILLRRHRSMPAASVCIAGLSTAYVANAALCLVVYSFATGAIWSRIGWLISAVLIWPMLLEIAFLYMRAFRSPAR